MINWTPETHKMASVELCEVFILHREMPTQIAIGFCVHLSVSVSVSRCVNAALPANIVDMRKEWE